MKKIGVFLIVGGLMIPLLLLLFFGNNWVPSKKVGLLYSIMNAEITYKNEEYKKMEKSNERFGFLNYVNAVKYTIPFRYLAGGGLIFICIGGFIFIR
jgi:hypothetical protein